MQMPLITKAVLRHCTRYNGNFGNKIRIDTHSNCHNSFLSIASAIIISKDKTFDRRHFNKSPYIFFWQQYQVSQKHKRHASKLTSCQA